MKGRPSHARAVLNFVSNICPGAAHSIRFIYCIPRGVLTITFCRYFSIGVRDIIRLLGKIEERVAPQSLMMAVMRS